MILTPHGENSTSSRTRRRRRRGKFTPSRSLAFALFQSPPFSQVPGNEFLLGQARPGIEEVEERESHVSLRRDLVLAAKLWGEFNCVLSFFSKRTTVAANCDYTAWWAVLREIKVLLLLLLLVKMNKSLLSFFSKRLYPLFYRDELFLER